MTSDGKPHRALLWLVDVPPTWELPADWQHPDVNYEIVLAPDQQKPAWLTGAETIHIVPCVDDRDALRKSIAAIDLAAALPIDYILSSAAPKALLKAARRESTPLISLPPTP
jgi:hypothetical protein